VPILRHVAGQFANLRVTPVTELLQLAPEDVHPMPDNPYREGVRFDMPNGDGWQYTKVFTGDRVPRDVRDHVAEVVAQRETGTLYERVTTVMKDMVGLPTTARLIEKKLAAWDGLTYVDAELASRAIGNYALAESGQEPQPVTVVYANDQHQVVGFGIEHKEAIVDTRDIVPLYLFDFDPYAQVRAQPIIREETVTYANALLSERVVPWALELGDGKGQLLLTRGDHFWSFGHVAYLMDA
jgi:hypothetical protein